MWDVVCGCRAGLWDRTAWHSPCSAAPCMALPRLVLSDTVSASAPHSVPGGAIPTWVQPQCCPGWCPGWCPRGFCACQSVWFGGIIALCLTWCLVWCPGQHCLLQCLVLCPVWGLVACLVQYQVQQFPVSAHYSTAQPGTHFFAWFGTQFCAHCCSAWHNAQFCAWFHAQFFAQSSAHTGLWFSAWSCAWF